MLIGKSGDSSSAGPRFEPWCAHHFIEVLDAASNGATKQNSRATVGRTAIVCCPCLVADRAGVRVEECGRLFRVASSRRLSPACTRCVIRKYRRQFLSERRVPSTSPDLMRIGLIVLREGAPRKFPRCGFRWNLRTRCFCTEPPSAFRVVCAWP